MDEVNKNDLMARIFDAVPLPVLLVDDDVRIFVANEAARDFVACGDVLPTGKRAGEALMCANSLEAGCGKSGFCGECVIRNSTCSATKDHGVRRRKTVVKLKTADNFREANLLITTAPLKIGNRKLAILLLEDISDLIQMQKLIPICSKCKKIRNDKGYWQEVDHFISTHADVDFSHSYCPECAKELYPGLYKQKDNI